MDNSFLAVGVPRCYCDSIVYRPLAGEPAVLCHLAIRRRALVDVLYRAEQSKIKGMTMDIRSLIDLVAVLMVINTIPLGEGMSDTGKQPLDHRNSVRDMGCEEDGERRDDHRQDARHLS